METFNQKADRGITVDPANYITVFEQHVPEGTSLRESLNVMMKDDAWKDHYEKKEYIHLKAMIQALVLSHGQNAIAIAESLENGQRNFHKHWDSMQVFETRFRGLVFRHKRGHVPLSDDGIQSLLLRSLRRYAMSSTDQGQNWIESPGKHVKAVPHPPGASTEGWQGLLAQVKWWFEEEESHRVITGMTAVPSDWSIYLAEAAYH